MARPKATESQKEAVRAKIRHAAAELYREQGLSNLTARAIAVRAGVSPGTIYVHFGSLSELARSLWQGPVLKFEQHLDELASEHVDPLPRIRAMVTAYLAFARANPDLYKGTFLYIRPPNEAAPEKEDFAVNKFAQLLIAAIDEGKRRDVLNAKDSRATTQLIWGTLHGHLSLPVNLDRFQWQACSDDEVVNGLMHMLRV